MRTKETIPLTESQKLEQLLDVYSKVLHPDFFNVFRKQISATYEENKRQAYADAKISDNALAIEAMLIKLRQQVGVCRDHPELVSFHLKAGYKEFLKRFVL